MIEVYYNRGISNLSDDLRYAIVSFKIDALLSILLEGSPNKRICTKSSSVRFVIGPIMLIMLSRSELRMFVKKGQWRR